MVTKRPERGMLEGSVMRTTLAGLVLAALAAGCGEAEGGGPTYRVDVATAAGEMPPSLSGAGVYTLWLEVAGERELVASTTVLSAGFDLPEGVDPLSADRAFVGVGDDTQRAPLLSGAADARGATLRLNVDISEVFGQYVLNTPTDDSINDMNPEAGIWFLASYSDLPPQPVLELPDLPAGWVWEGWVRTQGRTLSTGRFVDAVGEDSRCFYCGPDEVPGFPGEDFVADLPDGVDSVNLQDGSSEGLITLEPGDLEADPSGDEPFWPVLSAPRTQANPATPENMQAAEPLELRLEWAL